MTLLLAGRRDADVLDRQPLATGSCSGIGVRLRGQQREQPVQPVPALAGGDEALPVGDGEIDRRQRARRSGSSRR